MQTSPREEGLAADAKALESSSAAAATDEPDLYGTLTGEEGEGEDVSVLQEEAALGSTPAGTDTNRALRGLSRAARSFLLYDPGNEAIRAFLTDYRAATEAALAAHGAMVLEIRPFEMVREGEIVYLERDRERSLAFRLFRDGVRRLQITPGVAWSELLRLLEILSIRYTGVRQQEDDVVTLLWKAGFQNIEINAVEGFVPDQDDDEEDAAALRRARAARRTESQVEVPRDWDQPLPVLEEEGALVYQAVEADALDALRAEGSSTTLPDSSVRLVEEMLRVVVDPTDPTEIRDVEHLVNEVRDFLLSEGQLGWQTRLARSVRRTLGRRAELADDTERILATFTDARALKRIIHSASRGSEEAPSELIELLELVPSDHLSHLIELLNSERATASRAIARQLITHYARSRVGYVLKKLPESEPGVARDLLRALADAVPGRAVEAVEAVAATADTEVQFEMLRVLEDCPFDPRVRRLLMRLLDQGSEDVRMRALQLLADAGEPQLFSELVSYVESRATGRLEKQEAQLIGRILAAVDPAAAQKLLSGWIRPRGFFRRWVTVPGQHMLRWTAVAGVGRLPGDKNEALIRWLADQAGADLRKHCMHTLFLRRKEGTLNV